MYVPAQPPPSWQLSGEAHWVNFLVEPEHESCSERALACQLTRPVIYPLLFLSYCFSGHTDTRLPPHFHRGVAITSISTGQTALPRALGAQRPGQQRRALHASRSRRQQDTRGARGRFCSHEGPWGLPSEWSTTQACHPSSLSPRPPYAMGVSVLCLPHRCILGPQTLPGFTGSQRERNSASG